MTHILGWKNSKSVFISGDSAITSTTDNEAEKVKLKLRSKKSTFGERHIKEDNRVIQESSLKLYSIGESLILGFAGSAATAFEVIDIIKKEFTEDEVPDQIITRVLYYHRFPRNIALVAGFIENGEPILLSYNYQGNRDVVRHEAFVTIGSLDPMHTMASVGFAEFGIEIENDRTDDDVLVMINAAHQAMIVLSDLVRQGVGGFFTGLRVDADGVNWQKDTAYITYDINPQYFNAAAQDPNLIYSDPSVVDLVIRDNIVAIASPFPDVGQQRNIYRNYLRRTASNDEKRLERQKEIQWYADWGEEVNDVF